MTKQYEDRGAFFGALLMEQSIKCHTPGPTHLAVSRRPALHDICVFVAKLRAFTKTAKSVAIARCNYNSSELTEKIRDNRQERHEKELNRWLEGYGLAHCRVKLGGDPRGCCGSLIIEGLRGDGWGDGFAVY